MKKETKERLEIDENDIKAVYHFTLCKFTMTSDSFIGNNSFVGLKDVTRVNKTNDIISLHQAEQRVAEEIIKEIDKEIPSNEQIDLMGSYYAGKKTALLNVKQFLKHQYDI